MTSFAVRARDVRRREIASRDGNQGNLAHFRIQVNAAAQLEAVDSRQPEVGHDRVRNRLRGLFNRLKAAFIGLALALQRQTTTARARRLFSYSLAYLALLFVAMALDPLLV